MTSNRRVAFRVVALSSIVAAALTACGPQEPVNLPADAGSPPVPAVTSVSPDPGPFNGTVSVTLTTDKPATIFVTTDGSDPSKEGPERQSAESTLTLELKTTTTLTFYSHTPDGADEAVRSVQFIRAGGPKGTVSGVVVVDTIAVGHALALFNDFSSNDLGTASTAKEIPFTLTDVADGQHRLVAYADTNDDGNFVPVLDEASQSFDFTLDSTDPFKASVENVRLYLGAPRPGTCVIQGTITHPNPLSGETLRVSALSPSAFGQGADPQSLLTQFQNGYLILADPMQTSYSYALTDLEPGNYVIVPTLTTLGNGGLGMDVLANPLKMVSCDAGEVTTADFDYGPLQLSGSVTLQPATAPTQSFVYGVVAARSVSLQKGIQALLSPVVFGKAPGGSDFTGGYAARGLRKNATFSIRVFTNLDSQNPVVDALSWTVNVFGGAPAQVTVQTGTADTQADVTVSLP